RRDRWKIPRLLSTGSLHACLIMGRPLPCLGAKVRREQDNRVEHRENSFWAVGCFLPEVRHAVMHSSWRMSLPPPPRACQYTLLSRCMQAVGAQGTQNPAEIC